MLNQDFDLNWADNNRGFGAQFKGVLCLIDYCIINEVKMHVNIINNGYSDDNQNTWEILFDQPFLNVNPNVVITDPWIIVNFSKKYWKLGYGSNERKKYCDNNFIENYRNMCKEYIHIKSNILDDFEQYYSKYQNKKILGIHKRGRDHLTTGHARNQEYLLCYEDIFSIIDNEIDDYDYLFLTSDEYDTYLKFFDRYKNKLLIYDDKEQYSNNKVAINFLQKNNIEKVTSLKNLLIEILFLSKCDKMLLMNSNVSHMALFFSNHYNYQFYDEHLIYN